VAVIVKATRVLVIRRGEGVPYAGHWSPVSGKIEPGEAQRDALVREVREELGVGVRPLRKTWECPSSDGAFRLHWWLAVLADASPPISPDPREVADYRWIQPGEFRTLSPIFEADLQFFERVLPAVDPWPG